MITVYKKVFLFLAALLIFLSIVISLVLYKKNDVVKKYSFSETQDVFLNFSDNQKENINAFLSNFYVEDDKYCGFSNKEDKSVDLYTANAIVLLMQKMPNYSLIDINEKLSFLSNANIESFDLINLIYYVNICKTLDIKIDFDRVNNRLLKYYDKNEKLFFINSEKDSINSKIIATANVKDAMENNLSTQKFFVIEGVKNAYNNYQFLCKDDITLFNSGGDILYCLTVFGMDEIIELDKLEDWFGYWKNVYESINTKNYKDMLVYSEFIYIAKIFDHNYPVSKLNDFYNNLNAEIINEISDPYMLNNILQNVELLDNDEVNALIIQTIENVYNSDSFIRNEINIQATVYGIMIAQKTDYPINMDKIKKYIESNYKKRTEEKDVYKITSTLYYNLILDQLINGYIRKYDNMYYQNMINEVMNLLGCGNQFIAAEIISSRMIVEIISDLNMFNVELKLSNNQKKKIKKIQVNALKNEQLKESVLINDLYIIDDILSLSNISEKEYVDIYNKLTVNGGTASTCDGNETPDLNTTFRFFANLNRINETNYLQDQKIFVEKLKKDDGIYMNNLNNDMVDICSILYGNAINNYECKTDETKLKNKWQ